MGEGHSTKVPLPPSVQIKTMGKPEGLIETYLTDQIKANKWFCCKFTSPSVRGVPDRLILCKGRTIFVELKSDEGKLSDVQKYRIAQMKANGAEVYVIHSKEQVDMLIQNLKKRRTVKPPDVFG